jgi:hypothetical protein
MRCCDDANFDDININDGGIHVAAGLALIAAAAGCKDYVAACGLRAPPSPLQVSTTTAVELEPDVKETVFRITEENIKDYYIVSSWGWKPDEKRAELFSRNSRYLLVSDVEGGLVAFTHFQVL